MGQIFKATDASADAPNVEDGLFNARFDGIETKFITGGQYGNGDRYEWSFTLLDADGDVMYDEGEPIEVQGLTSTSVNKTSQTVPRTLRYLKAIATAVEYAEFLDGDGLDITDLVGRKCQVMIESNERGWPKITGVLPAPKSKQKGARKVVTEDEAE